jgi:undecaprenyl-diphosphatase
MLQKLISFDKELLLDINNCNSVFFDDFFFIFSGQLAWLLTAAAIIYVIVKTQKSDVWVIISGLVLLILLSDQISSHLIKPLVARLRPTREPTLEGLVHIVHNYRGGGFSFVSSHAANGFAFAVFSALLFKNRLFSAVILLWAALTAYSRIYLGVHYPLDVLCGSAVGSVAGIGIYCLVRWYRPICCKRKITGENSWLIAIVFFATLAVISIWHNKLVFLG